MALLDASLFVLRSIDNERRVTTWWMNRGLEPQIVPAGVYIHAYMCFEAPSEL